MSPVPSPMPPRGGLWPRAARSLRMLALAVACAGFAGACHLDRSPLLGSLGDVTPRQYCPGDLLNARFDLLQGETCPGDVDCAAFFPSVTLNATPMLFTDTTFRSFEGEVSFPAGGESVSVRFDIDRDSVTIPTDRFDDAGNRIFVVRQPLNDVTVVARRMTDFDSELVHDGVCMGSTPAQAPAMLPDGPQFSPQMRLRTLCNVNGVPIRVTLSGGAPGLVFTQDLPAGACLDTAGPGVPAGVDASTAVEAARIIPDPGARCSALGPNTPPAPLRTLARLGCG